MSIEQSLDQTFLSLGHGFHFSTTPPNSVSNRQNLQSNNPWEVLGCALYHLQHGEFDVVTVLPSLMEKHDLDLVWSACTQLIGLTGSKDFISEFTSRYAARANEEAVRWDIGTSLANSCGLWAIEPLLELQLSASENVPRFHVQNCLSALLEAKAGAVSGGPDVIKVADPDYPPPFEQFTETRDNETYVQMVRQKALDLKAGLTDENLPIAEGAVFSVLAIADSLYKRIASGQLSSARIEWQRMVFEANTGIDCRSFYSPRYLLQP